MSRIQDEQLKQLLEAAIFVSDEPISVERLRATVLSELEVSTKQLNKALKSLTLDYAPKGINLIKVSSGYRFQTASGLGQLLSKLWQETVPKYSRAMLETLALIAYKQPITRGEIEDIRGVAVNTNIIRSLTERNWIKVIGHKEVPGRPALLATTSTFLDYFALSSLSELPSAEDFASNFEAAYEASSKLPNDQINQKELNQTESSQMEFDPENTTDENTDAAANTTLPVQSSDKANIH